MIARIEFLQNINETTLPIIKLTKSRNGKTGTATFIFINPNSLTNVYLWKKKIHSLTLISNKQTIKTTDIMIFFKNGQPFLIKGIFIFKNSEEWFLFLNFMRDYSKQSGLSFSEK